MRKKLDLIDPFDPIVIFLDRAALLFRDLPFADLLPGEEALLGPYLRGDPRALVYGMAQLLLAGPSGLPRDERLGEELWQQQGQALSWLELIMMLEAWLRRARQSYASAQGRAVKTVLDLVKRIDAEDRLWWDSVSDEQLADQGWREAELLPRLLRRHSLLPIRRMLEQRRALCRPGKAAKAPKANPPAARGDGARPGKGRGKARGTAPGRGLARAQLQRLFAEELRRGRRR